LAKRLEEEKFDVQSATICYMCAQNPEKTISIWLNDLGEKKDTESLIEFMEKVLIYQQTLPSTTSIKLSTELVEKYSEYASLLASQGLMSSSLRYLNMIHSHSKDEKLELLRYRVYHSLSKPFGEVPKSPFKKIQIQNEQPVKQNNQFNQPNVNQFNQPMNSNINQFSQPMNQFNQPMNSNPMNQSINNFGNQPNNQFNQFNQPNMNLNPMNQFNQPNVNQFNQPNVNQFNQNLGPSQKSVPTSNPSSWNQPSKNEQLPPPTMGNQLPPSNVFTPQSNESFNPDVNQTNFIEPIKQNIVENIQPKTIETVQQPIVQFDVNAVQGDAQKVIIALNAALHEAFSGNVSDKNLTKKRMVESGLTSLFDDYKSNKIGPELTSDLLKYANYLNEKDYNGTEEMIKTLSGTHWKETKSFSKGMKFLNQILKDGK
jgi:protein transport protein SEC31